MALRKRLSDRDAEFPDPVIGINLRASAQDLAPGEAVRMMNCEFIDGIKTRLGSTRLNSNSLGAYRIRGGHKFYYATNSSKRLIAYGTNISTLSDAGLETVLTSSMTEDRDTHFESWRITDKVYVMNGVDKLYEYDGSLWVAVDTLSGAQNVPNGGLMVRGVLDRLMAISSQGFIERTNPRVAHIWSSNSPWATFRPQLGGPFTALHPHTLRSTQGDLFPGLLATQANAMYMITGSDYGSDVTSGTASSGENGEIKMIDSRIGTSSPYSICTVPGVGVFGVSSDLNVWWLPFGEASPRLVGDKIRSTGSTQGLESANISAVGQIWMQYFDRRLILGFPTGANTHCGVYFYLDMRSFIEQPKFGSVWNGPHTGFFVNRCWPEVQYSDNALMGGEGDPANGAYVYRMLQDTGTDAVGALDNIIEYDYQTFYHPFGGPSREKYVQGLHVDANCFEGTPTVTLYDITGVIATDLTLENI